MLQLAIVSIIEYVAMTTGAPVAAVPLALTHHRGPSETRRESEVTTVSAFLTVGF